MFLELFGFGFLYLNRTLTLRQPGRVAPLIEHFARLDQDTH
jgi:hypothetical protein